MTLDFFFTEFTFDEVFDLEIVDSMIASPLSFFSVKFFFHRMSHGLYMVSGQLFKLTTEQLHMMTWDISLCGSFR